MKRTYILLLGLIVAACGGKTDTAEESADTTAVETTTEESEEISGRVYFVSPKDGQTVTSPFQVEMGVEGMEVEPAGEVNEGFGHHHLIINGSYVPKGQVVPTDATHIHFGDGQTVTDDIELPPGKHTLTLQFADGVHVSYGEPLSATIEVDVAAGEE